MRVALVTPFYYPERKFGGPPGKIHSLAQGLRTSKCKSRVEVRVATFDHADSGQRARGEVEGVPVQYLPWLGQGLRQWPRDYRSLSQVVSDSDIVHCFGIYNLICPFAVREAAKQDKPIVIEPLGMFPPRARNQIAKRLYNETLTKWMVRRASAVIATSEAEANELEEIAPQEKIHHRRNGIDVEQFAALPSGQALREGWGIGEGVKVVVFVGRLSPIKNLEMLLAAFAALQVGDRRSEIGDGRNPPPSHLPTFPPSHASAKLVLVGPAETDYEARLRSLVAQEGIGEKVVFAGPLYEDEQKAALAAADLFVLPSLNESFGNAAGEAVAANLPVLLTDTCGIAPIIHQRAGLAVPLGVDSLAEGLKKMLLREFSDQMTARREEVKRELSWDEPVAQQIEVYREIFDAGKLTL